MKNYRYLSILFVSALILISIQTNQAFAATAKGQVVVIPFLCKGHISHFDHMIFGTNDNQRLVGTNQNDLIVGFQNTLIYGKAGDDCLMGGNGNNLIEGGPGNDVIIGGSGMNIIFTGNGNNIVQGGPSNDIIFFGHGHNTINGGLGTNYCIGNPSNSIIVNCIVISHSQGKHESHDSDKIIHFVLDLQFSGGKKHGFPSWMKSDLAWWDSGKISDDDISSAIQYFLDTS